MIYQFVFSFFLLPPSLTYPFPSLSFNMSSNLASKKKKSSTATSKPANGNNHAPHDINLGKDPQNILPDDTQQARKGTNKQIAIGKYNMIPC